MIIRSDTVAMEDNKRIKDVSMSFYPMLKEVVN